MTPLDQMPHAAQPWHCSAHGSVGQDSSNEVVPMAVIWVLCKPNPLHMLPGVPGAKVGSSPPRVHLRGLGLTGSLQVELHTAGHSLLSHGSWRILSTTAAG